MTVAGALKSRIISINTSGVNISHLHFTVSKYLNVSQTQILHYRIWSSDPGNGYQVKWRWRLIKHKKLKKKSLSSKSSDGEGLSLEASLPTLFSREEGSSKSVSKMRDFFTKEGGSIAVSEALCITHRVDIRRDNQSKLCYYIRSIETFIIAA